MMQVHLNFDSEDIQRIISESGANDSAKLILNLFFNQLMEKQRDDYIQEQAYERNETRTSQRNGYYDREFTTRIGTLNLHVPRTRDGKFSPSIFERFQRSEQSLILAMLEMVISGVSTRKVTKTIEILTGGHTVSKSLVSYLMKQLDPIVKGWRTRSLSTESFPYILCDAMYVKVREDHRVISKGVYITMGINNHGIRTILGFEVLDGESEGNWRAVFERLKERGLTGVRMVVSDAHKGLVKAIKETFTGISWQRCQAHFIRNIFDKLPKKIESAVKEELKSIFRENTILSARQRKNEFIQRYSGNKKLEAAISTLDEGVEDSIQILSFPMNIQQRLRTTNALERLNEEIRRRERVIRIFPNTASVIRIIGTLLVEKEDEWNSSLRKYLELNK